MRKAVTFLALLAAGAAFFLALGSAAQAQTPSKTCSDFATQQQAQAFYDAHKNDTPGNPDPDHLDADGDGKACEGLPSGAPVATAEPLAASTPAPSIPKNGAETGVMALSGLSLLEAGYGMTLLARRYGVKRRNIPVYLLKKLVSAGKSGQATVALGDDLYLVHESAFVATDEDYYTYVDMSEEETFTLDDVLEPDEEVEDVAIFMPAPVETPRISVYTALAKGTNIVEEAAPVAVDAIDEDDAYEEEPDPWDDDFAWRL